MGHHPHSPKFHWFGDYDELEFDPTSRYAMGMEAGCQNRSAGGGTACFQFGRDGDPLDGFNGSDLRFRQ